MSEQEVEPDLTDLNDDDSQVPDEDPQIDTTSGDEADDSEPVG